ncbi:MAG: oxygen-dependent coproporphyrinogen oxidase [Reichenbachiella sp.]|uniref:oxygen-dependent coproporphyrinogen oxidase n=1 Tax=Reichenbachiella sp. TaxID=2184521 RepID=UPI00326664BF
MNKEEIQEWFKGLQDDICSKLEQTDRKGKFKEDLWDRPEGGGGRTRVINDGAIIEKGGVNFSAVHGPTPDKILEALKIDQADFFATGVSIVMHPHSPMVPIIHMNVRYFEMSNGVSWFGGGIDLTPHYVVDADARYFHEQLKTCCARHDESYYSQFKQWADDYFYIKHRKETRGVGGIFFDRLSANEKFSLEDRWAFVKDVGSQFAPIYTHLMSKNKALPFTDKHKQWQYLRRGRYAEFNLVWDKGTKFGLDTDGRTESILMSLPPQANWEYNHIPETGSDEQKTLDLLKKGIDW